MIYDDITEFSGEYRWLSNFFPCEIHYDNKEFPSVEHAYVYAKNPKEYMAQRISFCGPGKAKSLGRKLKLVPNWDKDKLSIMENLVRSKFNDNITLAQKLKDTEDRDIIEGNNWGDTYWGQSPLGNGSNYLGKIIMKIRNELNDID